MRNEPRILILGASGQVGSELRRSFADAGCVIARDRTAVDIAKPEQVRAIVRDNAPDVILNAAAYTAVDRAESEPALALSVNAVGPGVLAEESLRIGALLVHYSTDYVFDGSKSTPWSETDAPNPLNVYGATKLEGERAIQQVGGKYLIFRTSWVYGPHGNNFLLTMLRLGQERSRLNVVDDQLGAPTPSIELADATRAVVASVLRGDSGAVSDWTGLYHMTCRGSVSWCGFAHAIFARAAASLGEKEPDLNPISTEEYPTPAKRPRYSVLSNEKLHARFGIKLRPWEPALDRTMERLQSQIQGAKDDGATFRFQ